MACSPASCVALYLPLAAQLTCPALCQADGIVGTSNCPRPHARKQAGSAICKTAHIRTGVRPAWQSAHVPPIPRGWRSLLTPHTQLAPARWEAVSPTPPPGGPSHCPSAAILPLDWCSPHVFSPVIGGLPPSPPRLLAAWPSPHDPLPPTEASQRCLAPAR